MSAQGSDCGGAKEGKVTDCAYGWFQSRRSGRVRSVSDLHQGGVFYDEGGVYVCSQTLNGYPRIVTGAGLLCTLGEIEYAFKVNGRVPKLARCHGVWGCC